MNKQLLLKLVQIWWEGFKVTCRLGALGIVLGIFCLPALGLTILSGEYAGRILIVALAVFVFPIVLYPTSRYLLLLDGNGRDVAEGKDYAMRDKIIISTVASFCIISFLSPPDVITQLTQGYAGAFLCAVTLLILARRDFMKSSSNCLQALVCVLVCMISVLLVNLHLFVHAIAGY